MPVVMETRGSSKAFGDHDALEGSKLDATAGTTSCSWSQRCGQDSDAG
ncbi:hypothetical protein [Ktedonosporobacter rubrisoli]|nr:hypothetical protein [Ktedonosporobacter rubrisoli]